MTAPSGTPWLLHGGTAVSLDRSAGRLVGRERQLDEVHGRLSDPGGPRLVLVRGERGVGRTEFVHAVGELLRARGATVLGVNCVPGDEAQPFLLALRLVMALEEHRPAGAHRRATRPATEALRAAEQRDGTAMGGLLRAALTHPGPASASASAPVLVMMDDIQHADAGSLAVLRETDFTRVPDTVRLLASEAGRGTPRGAGPESGWTHTLVLSRLGPEETTTVVARRLRATPDTTLARRVRELTLGVPGAVDALLTEWTRQGAIRVADGHAFVGARRPTPVPADHDRFMTALDALGEPCRTVAGALSILWPLGGRAARLIAASTGLSTDEVNDALRALTDADIIEVLPAPADTEMIRSLPAPADVDIAEVLPAPADTVMTGSLPAPADTDAPNRVDAAVDATATYASRDATLPDPDLDPVPDDTTPPGRRFRLPVVAHAVRERLGPLERSRLSAAAVEALWAEQDAVSAASTEGAEGAEGATPHPRRPALTALPDEADAVAYLADRVAEAGSLVDLDRAVAELTAAAQRLHPDSEGRGVLRWCRAAGHLAERPADRVAALHQYAKAAYNAGDHHTARTIAESVLRNLADVLGPRALQDTASLFTAATANDLDWRALSRLATARWWDELRLPDLAAVTGRALALSQLERWQEVLDLLARTEHVWATDAHARAKPAYFRAVAELALGRPERFRESLAFPEASYLDAGHVHALATTMFDELLSGRDLRAAEALLDAQGLTADLLAPRSLFLWRHLQGRWDEALESARWMLANNQTSTPAADSHLIPARTAAVLLARGRPTSARRLLDSVRGDAAGGHGESPLEYSLDAVEAEVLRVLGDPAGAEKALRRGLDAAALRGQIAGTDELWAALAETHAEEGRPGEAAACLRHLRLISDRTGDARTRLRYLLASAHVQRQPGQPGQIGPGGFGGFGTVRGNLREAVRLARSRSQPFETAVTLVAAAGAGAGPPALLHEAYELFGGTGAALPRFHTRTAMREAGTTVPGRRQATAENEQLLATLIAEGLTNRQIATVLRLSEDAVANRLTRLFARTGLRSRTEVVTAVLTNYRVYRGAAEQG
ncbi:helix-turn-helix transcriptional regulator [Streptomyces dioscori]|uniref:Helix-turn-helix transcriptional regulator n=1 Tax=Streptomyces dioscori TaxID=2109333 RepID=A0A2P8PVK8_9ACTN|nr:LuxR family transcriptional regulator [Streptomyces dioscori]PSM38029.1 helix-turn-helix transcriptional regulator [Streptomyces dioscori]